MASTAGACAGSSAVMVFAADARSFLASCEVKFFTKSCAPASRVTTAARMAGVAGAGAAAGTAGAGAGVAAGFSGVTGLTGGAGALEFCAVLGSWVACPRSICGRVMKKKTRALMARAATMMITGTRAFPRNKDERKRGTLDMGVYIPRPQLCQARHETSFPPHRDNQGMPLAAPGDHDGGHDSGLAACDHGLSSSTLLMLLSLNWTTMSPAENPPCPRVIRDRRARPGLRPPFFQNCPSRPFLTSR